QHTRGISAVFLAHTAQIMHFRSRKCNFEFPVVRLNFGVAIGIDYSSKVGHLLHLVLSRERGGIAECQARGQKNYSSVLLERHICNFRWRFIAKSSSPLLSAIQ